ncbi:DNA-binding protein [Macrococcus equipercicus]|uniref:DNA-binding protein n=1 Tax=Macrococcus equipercicus TaxID=69967 RepID=A0A9Q9F1S7_9STAP|nr:DNA-binding protein [Macrococcus equipercicus]KAA1042392.1 DNA-binding protein [Macrococcus equipercicus]UTH14277.1 DNA-binding protein [Macrococcus equipercicus]
MKKLWMLSLLLTGGCSEQQHFTASTSHATILFDTAHEETAGEADWVIDGAFSSYADALKRAGYRLDESKADALITYKTLKSHDIFVLPEPNIPLKESEQAALKQYAENGGSILFISDHYNADRNLNRFDASEVLNGYRRGAYEDPAKGMTDGERHSAMMSGVSSSDFLSETFGVRFRYNAIDNVTMTTMKDVFNITDGVKKVEMHAGSTMAITDPSKARGLVYLPELTHRDAWSHAVDKGVYNGGGQDEGPVVAISKAGKGKAAFIGDSSIVEDATPKYRREDNGRTKQTHDGFDEADHETLLMNLTAWLARQEDYTSFQEQDKKTPLHRDEEPAASVEPRKEPWARPEQGYLWYDRTTFAEGSYGAEGSDISASDAAQDDVQIISPDSAAPSENFQIKVRASRAVPTSIALVMSDGQQVGLFSGRPPGVSNIYTPRRVNNDYECYFNGRIAREAHGQLSIQVIQNKKVVATQMLNIN